MKKGFPLHGIRVFRPFKSRSLTLWIVILFLAACGKTEKNEGVVLIAIKSEAISLLSNFDNPDPANTGIPSLNDLNQKWKVKKMEKVFPGIAADDDVAARYGLAGVFKLEVDANTDVGEMIKDFENNPFIDYAESEQTFEIR